MRACTVFGILGLTLLTFRIVFLIHHPHEQLLANESEAIVAGHASWMAFQNRILGPALIHGLAKLFGAEPVRVMWGSVVALLAVSNALVLGIGRRMFGREGIAAWVLLLAWQFLFIVLQDDAWLYPWDMIDAITMPLLGYLIWADAGLLAFGLLFVVELFNREAGLFIGIWLAMDGGFAWLERHRQQDAARFGVGILLALIAQAWARLGRQWLHDGPLPDIHGKWIVAGQNLEWLNNYHTLIAPIAPQRMIPWILLAVLVLLAIRATRANFLKSRQVILWLLLIIGINAVLAVVDELRIWISVVPLLLPLAFRPVSREPQILTPMADSSA